MNDRASGLIYGITRNNTPKNFGHEVHLTVREGAKAVAKGDLMP
ncbi:MAG: hypothetical protein QXK90_01850 [Candidatus Parvarchaeota archaeon]